jgi:hypothetical protein
MSTKTYTLNSSMCPHVTYASYNTTTIIENLYEIKNTTCTHMAVLSKKSNTCLTLMDSRHTYRKTTNELVHA